MGWGSGNLGGGMSKGALKYPAITVKYPAGSICTVTNGSGKIYTALDTSGVATFAVDPGTYTVKAEQGLKMASKAVTVTAGGWIEVKLSFTLILYHPEWSDYAWQTGDYYYERTGGWTATHPVVTPKADGSVEISLTCEKDKPRSGIYELATDVDLSEVDSLVFIGHATGIMGYGMRLVVYKRTDRYFPENVANAYLESVEDVTVTLDTSAISGTYCIGFMNAINGWAGAGTNTIVMKSLMEG